MRYRTIVADPPWEYDSWPTDSTSERSAFRRPGVAVDTRRRAALPYPSMPSAEFVVFARRGTCKALSRVDRCVWNLDGAA